MSITNTIVSKALVAFVAIAMFFSLSFSMASAQTVSELQEQINSLLATIAQLQGQLGGATTGGAVAGVCPYSWTRSLATGATGADVMALQQFLNADPETRVAATGVGSAGQETQYFGGLTAAAVSKFQTKYRADVLSPLGLVNPTGYFGPSSMSKANMLCVSAPAADTTGDTTMDDTADVDDVDSSMASTEASLEDFDAKDGDDTDLEEGQDDAPIMDIEFDVQDGDIVIKRVDVSADPATGNDEQDPWDTFASISLWVDGDKIAEEDADSKSDWEKNTPATGDYRFRFTGLDQRYDDGDTAAITVGVSVQNSVNGTDDTETWDFFIPTDGIRGRDGAGVDQYIGDTADTVSVDINEEGGDDELKVQSSADDPDATTFQVEDSTRSGWTTIFAFDLDTGDSVNDITVNELTVNVVTPGDIGNDVISDIRLSVGSQTFSDWAVGAAPFDGTSATTTYVFDTEDDDFSIDAGDEDTVEVDVRFKKRDGTTYAEGQTIYASTTSDTVDAEGADDLGATQLSGSATGETHTLRTEGAILEPGATTATYIENDDTDTTDNEGSFTIKFDVTAFETDIYVNPTAATGTTMGTLGANFTITSGGSVASTASRSADLDSTADVEGSGRFKVAEGETETFTLTVEFDPTTAGFHRVNLYSFNWAATDADPTTQQLALPATDYRTSSLSI